MSCPFTNSSNFASSGCPFASKGKRPLIDLPEMSLETFQATPEAHREKIKLVIFEGYVFDVSADSSFHVSPLTEVLYADCTDVIMDILVSKKQTSEASEKVTFKALDKFSQMQMKSDMLSLFSEKYNPIAKIRSS